MTDVSTEYTLRCYNASAAVYLYGALCLQPQGYEDRIDKSARGYMLWLYAGNASLDLQTLKILNIALEDKNIDIRVRKEIVVESPALGRRQFVGNRFVLRLERSGLEDLIGTEGVALDSVGVDGDSSWVVESVFTSTHYAAMARHMPRLAQRHMSYVDVDSPYDLVFKPQILIRGANPVFTCCIVQNNRDIAQLSSPTKPA